MPPSLGGGEEDHKFACLANGSRKRRKSSHAPKSGPQLNTASSDTVYDLICVGFGPASLAIAIALHDSLEETGDNAFQPKICFLEKQQEFRWHAGMMLPDAKMQISFLKDLAMQRNPRSYFTFLNYLKVNNRLAQFTNLSTFLPTRLEFADYMKWCSLSFAQVVEYGSKVISIEPTRSEKHTAKYDLLSVNYIKNGEITTKRTRKIVIAVGGRPDRPDVLPENHPRIIHSSIYADHIGQLLKVREKSYNICVLGSGQSAAEIFHDLHTRYPNTYTSLIFRDSALRPSDDSPFVNEIFDDDKITPFFAKSVKARQKSISENRSTNYSVVHPDLLEKIYHDQYQQRICEPNQGCHQHRIFPSSTLVSVTDLPQNKRIKLVFKSPIDLSLATKASKYATTTLSLDLLVHATGYTRDLHIELLQLCQHINGSTIPGEWDVARNYSVKLNRQLVHDDVGIYLQGCNEKTHGLSDSLISVLAVRGGEVVQSLFGKKLKGQGNSCSDRS